MTTSDGAATMANVATIMRQSAVYGFGSVATKAISVILFPLYSAYFTVAEYGVIVRVEALWLFLWAIINFGSTVAVFKELHDGQSTTEEGTILSTLSSLYAIIGLLLIAALYVIREPAADLLLGSPLHGDLIVLAGVLAVLESLLFVPLIAFRKREQPWIYVFVVVLNTVIGAGGQIIALESHAFNRMLAGVYLLRLAGPIVGLGFGWWVLRRLWIWSIDTAVMRRIVSYSIPVFVSSLLALSLSNLDRYLLGLIGSEVDVGLYGLGANVAGLVNLLAVSPVIMVLHASMWKKYAEPDAAAFFSRFMSHVTSLFCLAAVTVALLGYGIIRVLAQSPEYWEASTVIPILSLSVVFFGMTNVSFLSFYLHHRPKELILIYSVSLCINVGLNVALIPPFGHVGAAIAAMATQILFFSFSYWRSRSNYFVRYEWSKLLRILSLAVVWVAAGSIVRFELFWVDIAARSILCAGFLLGLYVTGVYKKQEWIALVGLVSAPPDAKKMRS